LDTLIEEVNIFSSQKKTFLQQFNIDEEEIKNFNKMSQDLHKKLNQKTIQLNGLIFSDKKIKIRPNIKEIEKSIICDINYENLSRNQWVKVLFIYFN